MLSRAWLLHGITRSTGGILEANETQIRFVTQNGEVFQAPISALSQVRCPWYYFGGGIKFAVGQKSYRFSFVRPNDGSDLTDRLASADELGGAAAAGVVVTKLTDIAIGRRAGAAWRFYLAERVTRR